MKNKYFMIKSEYITELKHYLLYFQKENTEHKKQYAEEEAGNRAVTLSVYLKTYQNGGLLYVLGFFLFLILK